MTSLQPGEDSMTGSDHRRSRSGGPIVATHDYLRDRVLYHLRPDGELASKAAGRRPPRLRLHPAARSPFTPAKRLQERLDTERRTDPDAADLLAESTATAPEVLKTVRLSTQELERRMGESEAAADDEVDQGPRGDRRSGSHRIQRGGGPGGSHLVSRRRAARPRLRPDRAARRLLDMAGSLDPLSPELMELRAELDSVTAGPQAPPAATASRSSSPRASAPSTPSGSRTRSTAGRGSS